MYGVCVDCWTLDSRPWTLSTLCLQVVHSDLKSQNVLLTRNWETAKIADAGVARFRHQVDVHGNEGVASVLCQSPEDALSMTFLLTILLRRMRGQGKDFQIFSR